MSFLDEYKNVQDFNPDIFRRFSKLKILDDFTKAKSSNPTLTQDQIAKKIGTSVSTLNRIRQDLQLKSFYSYDVPMKKSNKVHKEEDKKSCNYCNKTCVNENGLKIHLRSCKISKSQNNQISQNYQYSQNLQNSRNYQKGGGSNFYENIIKNNENASEALRNKISENGSFDPDNL